VFTYESSWVEARGAIMRRTASKLHPTALTPGPPPTSGSRPPPTSKPAAPPTSPPTRQGSGRTGTPTRPLPK
jgi:hypothetical protein